MQPLYVNLVGFTIINSREVEISNIKISHCSANIDSVNRRLLDGVLTGSNKFYPNKYLKQKFRSETCRPKSIEPNNYATFVLPYSKMQESYYTKQKSFTHKVLDLPGNISNVV